MAIEKMNLLHIDFNESQLQNVLYKMLSVDEFHPILASLITSQVSGLHVLQGDNPYQDALYYAEKICLELGIRVPVEESDELSYDRDRFALLMSEVYEKTNSNLDIRRDLLKMNEEYIDSIQYSKYLQDADFNLDDIFNLHYLKVRFGRLPIDNLPKLEFYSAHPFVFKSFHTDAAYAWCMYFSTLEFEGDIDNVFAALQFERIRIPDFFHGKPQEAIRSIEDEIVENKKQIQKINIQIEEIRVQFEEELLLFYKKFKTLNDLFVLRKYVINLGSDFQISGFSNNKHTKKIQKKVEGYATVTVLPPDSDERLIPPTKLKNGWFTKPFEMFVDMYGTPAYRDMDPTFFVAITYTLLFGIMFADLGQGLVLALLAGLLAWKTKMPLAKIGVRVGLSSALFGIVFGSFFGNEEIIGHFLATMGITFLPLHVFESEFIMVLLGSTIGLGILLITISITLNILLQFKRKNPFEAILSHNGIAGLVMYLGILMGVGGMLLLNLNLMTPLYILLVIGLPILVIFLKEPITHYFQKKSLFPHGMVDFFTQTFFEMFEIFLSFLANTMSFLRVGGFVLAHAGMMLVVYTLAEMVPSGFYYIVVILGNIFVMGLEGMIVGIQVLRLEFYEMFSRYFEGNGVTFQSMNKK